MKNYTTLSCLSQDRFLLDVSDIFYFFSARGGERESPRRREGGGGVDFIEISKGGVVQEGEGPRGGEGVCGKLGNWGGGGRAKYFFSGPKCPPRITPSLTPNFSRGINWRNQFLSPWLHQKISGEAIV